MDPKTPSFLGRRNMFKEQQVSDSSIDQSQLDKQNRKPLTVPKAPSFIGRRNMFKGRITHRKVVEMQQAHSIEVMKELNRKFKAMDVDPALLQLKLEKMTKEDNDRRIENHKRRQEELLRSMDPPRVGKIEAHKEVQPLPQEKPTFKANEVPMLSKVLMMDSIREREEEWKRRIEDNVVALLESAQMPQRMSTDLKRVKKTPPKRPNVPLFKAKSAPNFAALHSHLQQHFEVVRSEDNKTVPEPFHLSSRRVLCHQPTPEPTAVSPAKSLRQLSAKRQRKSKELQSQLTVLNEMKSESTNRYQREAFMTESDELLTTETNKRTAGLMAAVDDIWGSF